MNRPACPYTGALLCMHFNPADVVNPQIAHRNRHSRYEVDGLHYIESSRADARAVQREISSVTTTDHSPGESIRVETGMNTDA